MTNELKEVDTNDTIPYERDNNMMTKVKWSTETNDIDNRFLRDYENMHKSMEDRQINDFYEARRHIQSTMMGCKVLNYARSFYCSQFGGDSFCCFCLY